MIETSSLPAASPWAWRQWPRETRDVLFLLAVVAWITAPHFAHVPLWCSTLTCVVLIWRAQLALVQGKLPARWMVVGVLVLAVALTAYTQRSLMGKEAGLTLLVLLVALKTLELRARRDAMVVFFLGFFIVLTQCFYSQSLASALSMVVAAWGLLTALVMANMPVGRPALARAAGIAARTSLLGLPVMAALFLLFPRIGPLWGLPQDAQGRSGLSGTLRMGGVADLAMDDTIAFRVRFKGPPPPSEALYFRGPVLTRFDGQEWQASLFATDRDPSRPLDLRITGTPVRYEMLLEPPRMALIPLLEATPMLPTFDPPLVDDTPWFGRDMMWRTERPVMMRLHLTAQAWPHHALGVTPNLRELQASRFLPTGFNPRTLAWAQALRERLGPVDERTVAAALMAHISQANYVYTLQPGLYGNDAIDSFWLDRREGFCEHYASAFVVIMRALGVPARIVTGYQGAEQPDADGYRVVRQSHAHAWAEYWVPGAGWQRADPTAAVAPERVRTSRALVAPPGLVAGALQSMNPALLARLRQAWELMDSRWSQWVMTYSRGDQFDLLKKVGVKEPDWADVSRALVIVFSAAALAGAAWAAWDRRRQDPWQRLQRRLCKRLQGVGVPASAHLGPRALAELVRQVHGEAGQALATLLEDLERQRYAPGGQRLPGRQWWPQVARALRRLPNR
jgi:transglutaminase-like putative cysteine protease